MKRILLSCCFVMLASTAWAQVCEVADPSGTPLNVRDAPWGRILGALHNGTMVRVTDIDFDHQNRRWARIVPLGEGRRGWVYRNYLDCN